MYNALINDYMFLKFQFQSLPQKRVESKWQKNVAPDDFGSEIDFAFLRDYVLDFLIPNIRQSISHSLYYWKFVLSIGKYGSSKV